MIVVLLSEYFSDDMGYSENCLPRALAAMGLEVHVVASNLQVYGNLPVYQETYESFLGPAVVEPGVRNMDGYILHRLPHRVRFGAVEMRGLGRKLTELRPDIVQTHACLSQSAVVAALYRARLGYRLFTECHQHMSISRRANRDGSLLRDKVWRGTYFLTRTVPGRMVSLATVKCFPVAPDCAKVAETHYGVEPRKISLLPLGSDTVHFHPVEGGYDEEERRIVRRGVAVPDGDILCIYTGRFSVDKDPALLAQAVSSLRRQQQPYSALFIGNGVQLRHIESEPGCRVIPFCRYGDLPKYYRAADIGVWPRQESMSMLDAAASGLPIVVDDEIGDRSRVDGAGYDYRRGSVDSLVRALLALNSRATRLEMGRRGRERVVRDRSWASVAERLVAEYGAG